MQTLSDFLAIYLVYFPFLVFLVVVIFRGTLRIFYNLKDDWEDNEKKNFFHHHFHYKAKDHGLQ